MKSPSEIATLWDGKPDTEANAAAAVEFVGNTLNTQSGKASTGIGHCLRASEQNEDIIDHCFGMTLKLLGRHGLGRPGLRLMTTCLIATASEPGTTNAFLAGRQAAEILDNPQFVRFIKPRTRLEGEGAVIFALGTETMRGRRAVAASIHTIQSDRNDRPRIPIRDKLSYIEFVKSAAAAAGMGQYTNRADEVEMFLEIRAGIPRRDQVGNGVFYLF